ncbi:GIY-YIG nuclease family protein [Kitasatospora cinereorecta]|uniref:GIY-YIG nuclease family protein n=2 Tax=Kitasatospora cinereorecta TaxID=285560 RepID=A0ABW0VQF7_9ACTN
MMADSSEVFSTFDDERLLVLRSWISPRDRVFLRQLRAAPQGQPSATVRPVPPGRSQHIPLRSRPAFTYVVGVEGSPLVKIGIAADPKKRLSGLQTAQPLLLSLLLVQQGDYERALHRRFSACRVRGEWFDLTDLGDPVEVVRVALAEIIQDE